MRLIAKPPKSYIIGPTTPYSCRDGDPYRGIHSSLLDEINW